MFEMVLLNDDTLGFLLKIYFGAYKEEKGKIEIKDLYSFNYKHRRKWDDFDEILVSGKKVNFASKNVYLGSDTIDLIKLQLSQSSFKKTKILFPTLIKNGPFNTKAALRNWMDELKEKQSSSQPLSPTDIQNLEYYQAEGTLKIIIEISSSQIKKITKYIKNYYQVYFNKKLWGQGKILKPSALDRIILKKINNPKFIKKYGKNNLTIKGENNSLFCHSLMSLHFQGLINLLGLHEEFSGGISTKPHFSTRSSYYSYYWVATLNNYSFKKKIQRESLLKWDGLSLNTRTGQCSYTGQDHKFKTELPPFKIIKKLLEECPKPNEDGNAVTYDEFFEIVNPELKNDSKNGKEIIRQKIRDIRRHLGINRKKSQLNDIFHETGNGYQLTLPS